MTNTAVRPGTRDVDIDWTAAARTINWVPAEYREPTEPATAARLSLRCSERSFQQLVDLGLPATETPDGPLFDLVDLKNAGLYSGSGVTDVEVGMRFMLRYMHESKDELTRARRWTYGLRLLPEAGGTEPMDVYRPTPEDSGGELHTWQPAGAYAYDDDFFRMAPGSEVTGTMTTRGEPDTILSPVIRQTMLDLVDSGVRWQYVPKSLELRPLEAIALGGGSCAVLCAVLVHLLREAGVESRSCHGWMIAVSQVVHSWVEVVDDDGRTKFLDPSLALLATGNGFGPREFRDFVIGSKINRIVLTRCPLLESFVAGTPYDTPDITVFTCRSVGR